MPDEPDQPSGPGRADGPGRAGGVLWGRAARRRERIRAEVARNRAGGHRVPTWALAAVLGVILLGWLYLIIAAR